LIGAVAEFETIEKCVGSLGALAGVDSEVGAVEEENLASREGEIEIRTLLHDSYQALDDDLFGPDVVRANPCLAAGWADAGAEDASGCRLACAVWAEEAEDFSG
jgi:hypothetical protein